MAKQFSPYIPLWLLLAVFTILGLFPGNKAFGQAPNTPAPDCVFFINATYTGASAATISYPVNTVTGVTGFDNRTLGCQTYTFQYTATATSGTLTSLDFQAANGAVSAGSFSTWGGTVDTGINPNTSSVTGTTTFSTGCASAMECNVVNGWVKILLTRNNFVGHITGVLYGYRTGSSGGGGGGGGGGGCPDPCPVTQDTVPWVDQVTGTSTALADTVSNTVPLQNAGASASGQRTFPVVFNGTTWDRSFYCPLSAAITLSSATDAVIVPLTSSVTTRVCSIIFSSGVTSADVTIRQGTGTTCGTSQVALSGAFSAVTGLALDFYPVASLRTTVAARDVCLHFSTAVTAGGIVTYAQY